jgi:hypothetical protein
VVLYNTNVNVVIHFDINAATTIPFLI